MCFLYELWKQRRKGRESDDLRFYGVKEIKNCNYKKIMEYGIVICCAFEIDILVKRRLRLEVASQEFEEED